MQVQLAVIADAATVLPNGKLNIEGVYDTILVSTFPAVHAVLVLVMRFRFDYQDAGRDHQLEIVLRDEDFKECARVNGQVHDPKISPGKSAKIPQLIYFHKIKFDSGGLYTFHVYWDGNDVHQVDLEVASGLGA